MTATKSFFLHFIRWFSALMVVLGHTRMVGKQILTNSDYSGFYTNVICSYDHSSVVIFFVLSGYVIYYTSKKYNLNDKYSVKKYVVDRFSRIYSLLIPAIFFTCILDIIGYKIFPAIYHNNEFIPQKNIIFRFIWNLFSMQGTWGPRIQMGSNAALWSIGYEFSFYLIFTIFIYYGIKIFNKWKGVLLLALFLLIKGPLIFGYLIIWILGCLSCYFAEKKSIKINIFLYILLFIFLLVFKYLLYNLQILSINNEYIQDLIYGFIFSVFLFLDFKKIKLKESWKKYIINKNKIIADFSFTLYGIHLPLVYFLYSVINYSVLNKYSSVKLFSVTIAILCLLISYFFSFVSEKKRSTYANYIMKKINK